MCHGRNRQPGESEAGKPPGPSAKDKRIAELTAEVAELKGKPAAAAAASAPGVASVVKKGPSAAFFRDQARAAEAAGAPADDPALLALRARAAEIEATERASQPSHVRLRLADKKLGDAHGLHAKLAKVSSRLQRGGTTE